MEERINRITEMIATEIALAMLECPDEIRYDGYAEIMKLLQQIRTVLKLVN